MSAGADIALSQDGISSLPATPGEVIDGKYRIGGCIAWGGMGVVFEATHIDLDTQVALKCVRAEFACSEEVVSRFLNEARAAARLGNEHVARVLDFGRLADGTPYMVMERLQGQDLAALLFERGPLPLKEAVSYMLETAEGLAEAHLREIVHRDLKPENLFVTRTVDGRSVVKILDFGISKNLAARGRAFTNPARSIGSPSYMSPEQMRNAHETDARSDIWSLGVVLFQLLTCDQPFRGDTLPEICASVLTEAPRALAEARPDLPPQIDAIVRHCLQKDRASRFQDVREFAEALAPFGPPGSQQIVERIERIFSGADAIPSGRPSPSDASSRRAPSTPPAVAAAAARHEMPTDYHVVVDTSLDRSITTIPGVHARWPYALLLLAAAAAGGVFASRHFGYDPARLVHRVWPTPTLGSTPEPDVATHATPVAQVRAAFPLLAAPRSEPELASDAPDLPPRPVQRAVSREAEQRAARRTVLFKRNAPKAAADEHARAEPPTADAGAPPSSDDDTAAPDVDRDPAAVAGAASSADGGI